LGPWIGMPVHRVVVLFTSNKLLYLEYVAMILASYELFTLWFTLFTLFTLFTTEDHW
jgi:hypothetical protein